MVFPPQIAGALVMFFSFFVNQFRQREKKLSAGVMRRGCRPPAGGFFVDKLREII